MSSFIISKVNGNQVDADEWNQLADYNTLLSSSGQTPSSSNINQGSIAAARYASAGQYFLDSGTANAYVLSPVAPFKAPVDPTLTYFIGMIIRFRAGNANSGASTVNVNSAGVKNLKKADGTTDLDPNDISALEDSIFGYNGTVFVQQNKFSYHLKTIQTFTASGTWTKPAACRAAHIKLVGGGGSGGNSTSGGTGGGGGGYSEKFITSGLGATETITVGLGGTAATNGNNGNTGGTTSFGAHCSATGGTGGKTANGIGLGTGGVGASGNINIQGGSGGMSISTTLGGFGGASVLSNSIAGAIGLSAGTGFEYGGGSGGSNGGTGAAGAAGIVIVYEYY
jgi:hypothetical protein